MKNLIAFAAGALIASTAIADAHLPKVDAEVRRVDAAQNKLALRHGEIPNLDMPPMSMVFQVADPALLDGLKPGDKLMVTIDEIDGAYTVLSVERAQP
ncbi:copper-binding protein [Pseudazoarcus pumilus]|uniref:RND transporter n=1 Tax=Pseudazoarcus pumilus TaxID=2067960 RepID=A0A2I6S976_9RHOO|nr:copper-binding protein [Pseudazoarcus pumilus]AUN95813.1 RND transporter [Pseudazoarcus pumilus]